MNSWICGRTKQSFTPIWTTYDMGHLVRVDKMIRYFYYRIFFLICSWKLQFAKFYTAFVQRNGLLFHGLLFALNVCIIQHRFTYGLLISWIEWFFCLLSRMIVMISWVSFWLRADSAPRITLGKQLKCFQMNCIVLHI